MLQPRIPYGDGDEGERHGSRGIEPNGLIDDQLNLRLAAHMKERHAEEGGDEGAGEEDHGEAGNHFHGDAVSAGEFGDGGGGFGGLDGSLAVPLVDFAVQLNTHRKMSCW